MSDDPFNAQEAGIQSFFGGGGGVSAKFPSVGFTVEGTILGMRKQQQTHADSKEPLFWEGNRPVEQSKLKFPSTARPCDQVLIDLQGEPTGVTYQWDAVNEQFNEVQLEEDDGVRTLYVKGRLQIEMSRVLKDAGLKAPEIGGYLKVTRTANVKGKIQGRAYTYSVEYTKAAQNTKAVEDAMAGPPADPFAK